MKLIGRVGRASRLVGTGGAARPLPAGRIGIAYRDDTRDFLSLHSPLYCLIDVVRQFKPADTFGEPHSRVPSRLEKAGITVGSNMRNSRAFWSSSAISF